MLIALGAAIGTLLVRSVAARCVKVPLGVRALAGRSALHGLIPPRARAR